MAEETSLVVVPTESVKPIEVIPEGGDERVAYHLWKSGFFKADIRGVSQAVSKIILGRSLGIDPASAVMGLYITGQGKLSMSANLMVRCIKAYKEPETGKTKYRLKFVEKSSKACEIEVFERYEEKKGDWVWESLGTERVVLEDMKHLASSDVWKKYPKNMLFARCVSNVAKFYTADVFGGSAVYTPDEIPNSGATVDGETLEVKDSILVDELKGIKEAEFEISESPTQKKLKSLLSDLGITLAEVAKNFGKSESELKILSQSEEGANNLIRLLSFKGKKF